MRILSAIQKRCNIVMQCYLKLFSTSSSCVALPWYNIVSLLSVSSRLSSKHPYVYRNLRQDLIFDATLISNDAKWNGARGFIIRCVELSAINKIGSEVHDVLRPIHTCYIYIYYWHYNFYSHELIVHSPVILSICCTVPSIYVVSVRLCTSCTNKDNNNIYIYIFI